MTWEISRHVFILYIHISTALIHLLRSLNDYEGDDEDDRMLMIVVMVIVAPD